MHDVLTGFFLRTSRLIAEIKMAEKDINALIGEAWSAHYQGQHDVAIEKFSRILSQDPDNIDANWGLGLSYRSLNQNEAAREIFLRIKQLIADEVAKEVGTTPGRYVMLNRMVEQQLQFLEQFIR